MLKLPLECTIGCILRNGIKNMPTCSSTETKFVSLRWHLSRRHWTMLRKIYFSIWKSPLHLNSVSHKDGCMNTCVIGRSSITSIQSFDDSQFIVFPTLARQKKKKHSDLQYNAPAKMCISHIRHKVLPDSPKMIDNRTHMLTCSRSHSYRRTIFFMRTTYLAMVCSFEAQYI